MDKKTQDENAAGAPGSLALNGRTFLVAQATHADLMAVRKRLKAHVKPPLVMYADLVSDPNFRKLPRKVREQLAHEAGQLKMRGEVALSAELAADMLMEPAHCRFLAWILLRKSHPELKLEELTPLIDEANAAAVYFDLERESGMKDLVERGE